jgi:hypothetical protein
MHDSDAEAIGDSRKRKSDDEMSAGSSCGSRFCAI